MHTVCKAAGLAAGAFTLVVAAIGMAAAAGLGDGQPYPARRPIDGSPRHVPATPMWQGLYLGGHLGYGFGDVVPDGIGSNGVDIGGIAGGLHAGYNWQSGNVVAGLEIDGSLARIDGSRAFAAGATEADHDWLSSARARLGYAFGDALVYGTAGIGYGGLSVASIAPGLTERISTTQFGYVVGAGVEMKFTAMISGRLEALHYGFGQKDFAFSGGSGRVDADVTTVRAGLSLHLN